MVTVLGCWPESHGFNPSRGSNTLMEAKRLIPKYLGLNTCSITPGDQTFWNPPIWHACNHLDVAFREQFTSYPYPLKAEDQRPAIVTSMSLLNFHVCIHVAYFLSYSTNEEGGGRAVAKLAPLPPMANLVHGYGRGTNDFPERTEQLPYLKIITIHY